ncbi:MAG: glucose-6-phosphate dehydrogenase [Actinomycetota bacterium]|nr:glucose-6-phosphate dehydrogenase [Actinomycetota bacterium]
MGDVVTPALTPPDHVIVVFGANGDLARRKLLPALFHLDREGLMPANYRIVGNSRSEMSDDDFRAFARDAIKEFGRASAVDDWGQFAAKLSYVSHEFTPSSTQPVRDAVDAVTAEVGGDVKRLFYLAVPPVAFAPITEGLGRCGLAQGARVVYEKPFGVDLASFQQMNGAIRSVLQHDQIYLIDHFLGKETVQNILALRFANGMFEPVWNRRHLDSVIIDVPETLSIGTRAGFYENVGALRDMIVTHLMQVLTFIAMEPPEAFTADAIGDAKEAALRALRPFEPSDVVRGQYEGYRQADGVAEDSDTETFVAARVFIDNDRWEGVPFYLRTGKCLKESYSRAAFSFWPPPRDLFKDEDARKMDQNRLTLRLGPDEGIDVSFLAKVPGPSIDLDRAQMTFDYEGSFGSEMIEAYERLIHDAMLGDRTLFNRADGIGRSWEVIAGILEDPPPLHMYEPGSWGPLAANELIAPRRWAY